MEKLCLLVAGDFLAFIGLDYSHNLSVKWGQKKYKIALYQVT